MKGRTLFGKEPIFWVGLIQAVFAFVLTLDEVTTALHLSDEGVGAIMAVLFGLLGVYESWTARDTLLTAVTAAAKAVIALLTVYGLHISPDTAAAVLGFMALVVNGWFLRDRTSPLVNPSFSNSAAAPVLTQAELARAA